MNYQKFSFGINTKKYLEFFNENNDGTVEYNLFKGFNNFENIIVCLNILLRQ